MSKIITIKLTMINNDAGPFNIFDGGGNVIAEDVSRKTLSIGVSYIVDDTVTLITLTSTGRCKLSKTVGVTTITEFDYAAKTKTIITACLWRHLTNIEDYNRFYGTGVFNYNAKIETNDQWFNKAILYNGQQSSGILNLVSKPLNNLSAHSQYPILKEDSKTIVYTKSDNFYQYNSFWALQKSSQIPLFLTSCENLSIDKVVNISNMDYSSRSFKKAPLRAKELRVRHILDNTSSIHLVSQFILTPAQISYK